MAENYLLPGLFPEDEARTYQGGSQETAPEKEGDLSQKFEWFKFEATAWLSDESVRLMSGHQRGWYIDLLAHCWQEVGIPDDPNVCKHLTSFWRDYHYLDEISGSSGWQTRFYQDFEKVFEMFTATLENGRRSHAKLEAHRSDVLSKCEKQSLAGKSTQAKLSAKLTGKHAAEQALRASDSLSCSNSSSGSISEETTNTETTSTRARETKAERRAAEQSSPYSVALEVSAAPILEECVEIYRLAGAPIPEPHKPKCLAFIALIPPELRARVPDFCKWSLATGRWPEPSKTKALLNVLRDGDWDVELTPRVLPMARSPAVKSRAAEAQDIASARFLARHGKEGAG